MAEIKIEKKSKRSIWPWIIGLLLLVGVIWVIGEVADSPEDQLAEEEMHVAPEAQPGDEISDLSEMESTEVNMVATDDFLAFVEDNKIEDQMGVDHQATSDALMKLSASLREISGGQFENEIKQIEENAQQIQGNPESLKHADVVSDAFTNAANVLEQIQASQFPDAQQEVQEVLEESQKISEDQQMLNQKENINEFFDEAADVIEAMKKGMQG